MTWLTQLLSAHASTLINYAVEYDWMPKEPSSTNSDFIRDILAYLESMFATLQLLPVISYSQPAYSCFVCMHS